MLTHPTGLFSGDYNSALRGAGPSNFLHTLQLPKCISSRTWGTGRPRVGLCLIFLVLVSFYINLFLWLLQLTYGFIGSGTWPVITGFRVSGEASWSMPSLLLAPTAVICCCRAHRRLRLTSYSVSWMRLHVLLVIRESSIAVWGSLCMPTFIDSTCRNEWSSSSCRWCITAFITRLPGTWRTAAFQSTTSLFCQASLPRCAHTASA